MTISAGTRRGACFEGSLSAGARRGAVLPDVGSPGGGWTRMSGSDVGGMLEGRRDDWVVALFRWEPFYMLASYLHSLLSVTVGNMSPWHPSSRYISHDKNSLRARTGTVLLTHRLAISKITMDSGAKAVGPRRRISVNACILVMHDRKSSPSCCSCLR